MRYVLDSSVALKWVLPEPLSDKARAIRDDFQKQIHELISPDVFPAEVGHGLVKAERRRIIQPRQAEILLADVLSTPPQLFPSYPDLIARAIKIATQTRSGVYDCLYVSLAEREGCELVTADDRLIRNVDLPFIVSLASMP